MSTESNEQFRAGFEAWAMIEGVNCDYTEGANGREYDLYETDLAWRTWVAAKREDIEKGQP